MRDFILSRKLPLRWAIIYLGIFIVKIFGYYGPGVNTADFVYMNFQRKSLKKKQEIFLLN